MSEDELAKELQQKTIEHNCLAQLANENGRDYVTPEDVTEVLKTNEENKVRLDLLEIFANDSGFGIEDRQLCAATAFEGKKTKYYKNKYGKVCEIPADCIGATHGINNEHTFIKDLGAGIKNWISTSDLHNTREAASKGDIATLYVDGSKKENVIAAVKEMKDEDYAKVNLIECRYKNITVHRASIDGYWWSIEYMGTYIQPMLNVSKVKHYKTFANCKRSLIDYLEKHLK